MQKLVELISAVQTSKDTLDRSRAFAEACGKGKVTIRSALDADTELMCYYLEVTTSQDVPGFVSNALLMPFINEAIMCLEKVAPAKTLHRIEANAIPRHRVLRRETTLTRRLD